MAIEVEDISYQHARLAGVRGSDGETHFNVKYFIPMALTPPSLLPQ